MGAYSEYLDKRMGFNGLVSERKLQLTRISKIRKRSILVYASDMTKECPSAIDYTDILPFSDQLSIIKDNEIDIILETPGGSAEVVEDLVRLLRKKFERIGVIIPGSAKSAGTIFAMAADEILMGPTSSLGPIDAQVTFNGGKRFSADAFLEGFRKIVTEAQANGRLNLAYIPMLQNISPGEIQHCENAQSLSRELVTTWLQEYKFKYWTHHTSTGDIVTDIDKKERASEIAKRLGNHTYWMSHSRSIKIEDLREMKLQVTDYTENAELYDAINRYYILLRMGFESNMYKIYETPTSQVMKFVNNANVPAQNMPPPATDKASIGMICNKCKTEIKIQVNFKKGIPLDDGFVLFPPDNKLVCPNCGVVHDLLTTRQTIEAQTKKRII